MNGNGIHIYTYIYIYREREREREREKERKKERTMSKKVNFVDTHFHHLELIFNYHCCFFYRGSTFCFFAYISYIIQSQSQIQIYLQITKDLVASLKMIFWGGDCLSVLGS